MVPRCRLLLALFASVTLASCASGAASPVAEQYSIRYRPDLQGKSYDLDFSVEEVVATLPAVYKHLGLAGDEVSGTEESIFVTPSLTVTGLLYEGERNSEYLNCGQGVSSPLADTYELEFVVVTRVRPRSGGGAVVESFIDGSAKARFFNDNPVSCQGTGKLEAQIVDALVIMLKQR